MEILNSIKKFIFINLNSLIVILLLIGVIISNIIFYLKTDNYQTESPSQVVASDNYEEASINEKIIKVDIKGQVKKPGVYEMPEGSVVYDLIQMAGGLKTGATTQNINLSKRLNNENVIIIYSSKELKSTPSTEKNPPTVIENCPNIEINNCDNENASNNNNSSEVNNANNSSNNSETSGKININSAKITELMTLSGIGESKAQSIITYRTNNGSFKKIEDLMNVSGIGESTFAKIKDNITI